MKRVPSNRYAWFFGIVLVGVAFDLWTKWRVFAWLGMPGEREPWWLVDGLCGFQTSLNEGALFGMGQGMVPVFVVLSAAAAIGIATWLFYARAARDLFLTIALAMVTAGILGNLYDRLGLPGLVWNYPNELHAIGEPVYAVRDFVLVMIGSYHWPNFNVADSLLVCGAILLSWHALFAPAEASETETQAAPGAGSPSPRPEATTQRS